MNSSQFTASGRRVAGVAALALCATVARAQNDLRLTGRVVDEAGQAVGNAQVVLSPDSRRVLAGDDGRFTIAGLRSGTYDVHVRRIGYQPASVQVDLAGAGAEVTVRLIAVPRVLDSIRVRERRGELRFSGVVVDQQGLPVPDAEVVAEGLDNKLRTDSEGHFLVRNVKRGTLLVRVRRLGYEPLLGSFYIAVEREDTLRMMRLGQSLSAVEILARSGFGRDTFAFLDLHRRLAWKATNAAVVSREELDRFGSTNLCDALALTASGMKAGRRAVDCRSQPQCLLINGERPFIRPLEMFNADDVEAVEIFPMGSDWSGTIAARVASACSAGATRGATQSTRPSRQPGGIVIWLRPGVRPP